MGNILLLAGIIMTLISVLLFIFGNRLKPLNKIGVISSYASVVLTISLYLFLVYLFLSHNFSYLTVYKYTNLAMPKGLVFVSVWAGQSGSLLLWAVFSSISVLIALKDEKWRNTTTPILLFILLIILILANNSKPFALNEGVVSDGLGLNPMLSHPLMFIHPPFAFLGYAILALVYSYAISSLIRKDYYELINKIQKWTTLSLLSFTVAIILGSLWAYEALGWGGYWAFDPIENGTLITWLFIVALIHSLILYRRYKRGLRVALLLSIIAYASAIHIVLLTRSGLLSNISTHSYVGDGLIYGLIITEIIVFILPLFLYILRFKGIDVEGWKRIKHIFYDEFALIISIILILLPTIVLIIGTNYPLFTFFSGRKNLPLTFYYKYFSISSIIFILGIIFGNLVSKHHPMKFKAFLREFFIYLFISAFITLLFFIFFDLTVNPLSLIISLIGFLAISSSFKGLKKHLKLIKLGGKLTSISVGILLIGIFFSSTQESSFKVNLFKERTFFGKEYSLHLKNEFNKIQKYIGEEEFINMEVRGNGDLFNATPSFWHFKSSSGAEISLPKPYIKKTIKKDYYISPISNGEANLKEGEERIIADYRIKILSIKEEDKGENFKEEQATLKIEFNEKEEVLSLNRGVDRKGFTLYSNPLKSKILGETIELKNFSKEEREITITSPSISNSIEFEIVKKPLMSFLRTSYYLMIIGLLLSTIYRFMSRREVI